MVACQGGVSGVAVISSASQAPWPDRRSVTIPNQNAVANSAIQKFYRRKLRSVTTVHVRPAISFSSTVCRFSYSVYNHWFQHIGSLAPFVWQSCNEMHDNFSEMCSHRLIDRQAGRQAGRQIDGWMDWWTDGRSPGKSHTNLGTQN